MVVWGLGVGVFRLGFLGWGFQLMGFKASRYFWVEALYININEKPWEKIVHILHPSHRNSGSKENHRILLQWKP